MHNFKLKKPSQERNERRASLSEPHLEIGTTNVQEQMSHWRHQAVVEQGVKAHTTHFGQQLVGNSGTLFAIRG